MRAQAGENVWLREAVRRMEQGGMCTLCLSEAAKGEAHDSQCPVGVALAEADAQANHA